MVFGNGTLAFTIIFDCHDFVFCLERLATAGRWVRCRSTLLTVFNNEVSPFLFDALLQRVHILYLAVIVKFDSVNV